MTWVPGYFKIRLLSGISLPSRLMGPMEWRDMEWRDMVVSGEKYPWGFVHTDIPAGQASFFAGEFRRLV
jgi:hypothetical protein